MRQHFVLPANFRPDDLFPNDPIAAVEASYLVHTIFSKTYSGDSQAKQYVRINSKLLRKVLCCNKRHKLVISTLVRHGVIEIDRTYVPGVRSRGYRLTKSMMDGLSYRRPVIMQQEAGQRVIKAWKEGKRKQLERQRPIHKKLDEMQKGLGFLGDPYELLATISPKARAGQHALVENIVRGETEIGVGTTGRVYNGMTSLKRNLRDILTIKFVTLHDEIYCKSGDEHMVVEAFEETFAELGIRMKYTVQTRTASPLSRTFDHQSEETSHSTAA
jgi:hypothetical protein